MWKRLRQRYAHWRNRRAFATASPTLQILALVQVLHYSPEIRKAFREALFGQTHQARKGGVGVHPVKQGADAREKARAR